MKIFLVARQWDRAGNKLAVFCRGNDNVPCFFRTFYKRQAASHLKEKRGSRGGRSRRDGSRLLAARDAAGRRL